MAIVLPRGTLKNYTDEYVRRHILRRAHIVAAVSLTGDMFKPFTNTKTCILFVAKRYVELEKIEDMETDPEIVFAVSIKRGKDKSGNLVHAESGAVISDLDEIASYVRKYAKWHEEEIK